MYPELLAIHSLIRWLVVISLILATFRAYRGWLIHQPFGRRDNFIRLVTVILAHLQLAIGLALYSISPIVLYFLQNFSEGIHQRDIRFFGMEHITMMTIGIALITIGSIKTKRIQDDKRKFKVMAICHTIALVIILASIPWPFSPFTSRPYLRPF